MLAAMLLPAVLIVATSVALGVFVADGPHAGTAAGVGFGCLMAGFLLAYVTALACLADVLVDRRVAPRRTWVAALLLGPAVAGPAYWWLHVRPGPGEPHGLAVLPPARRWPVPVKAATGAGALLVLLFWMSSIRWFPPALGADGALPLLAGFGVWTVVACIVLALFLLDALRTGGKHATLWGVLLLFAWVLAAPLYWLLYVRPTARPDGAP